jgi:hypothetical protein
MTRTDWAAPFALCLLLAIVVVGLFIPGGEYLALGALTVFAGAVLLILNHRDGPQWIDTARASRMRDDKDV